MSFSNAILGLFRLNKYFKEYYFFDYFFRLAKMRKDTIVVVCRNGFKFEVKTISDYLLIMDMIDNEYGKIPNASIIVDVGAHKGMFSILSSGGAKKVYSFEPSTNNFNILNRNIKLNNADNIHAIHSAVGGNNGKLKLYLSNSALGHSAYKKTDKFEEVPCISLDSLFDNNKIPRCDFLKVDCEGAEFDIFKNVSDKTFKKICRMVIEVHPNSKNDYKTLSKLLSAKGYSINLKEIDGFMHIFAKK